jgi:hypothetical protein
MALHLYNLQRDGGSIFILADIETKFFTINEKVARDKTLTKLAIGNVASTNSHHPIRSTPKDPTKIICFNCGEPGHKSPDCPKGKGGETKDNKVNTSADMAHNNNNNRPKKPRPSKKDSAQPAIVCSAHVVRLLEPSSPNSSVAHPIYLHDILVEQDKQERVTEEYPYSTVYDNAASRHYMQIHDNFVTLQFDVITNLDQSTAATVPVYLSVVHDHPFEEDLIPFARLVTVDLAAPQQKLWRALYQQTILPGLVHSFQVHPGSVGDGLYSQWHDMCRTIVTAKLATLATVGETHVLLVTTTDCGINITMYPENYHQPIFHLVTGDNY